MIRAALLAAFLSAACATPPTAGRPIADAFVVPPPAHAGRQVQAFVLMHIQADEVALLLDDIINWHCTRGIKAPHEPTRDEWAPDHVGIVHAAGNRIVLDGTPEMLAEAKELIARLDVPAEAPPAQIRAADAAEFLEAGR